ncbi:hypothetical protein GCM10007972_18240 [Iodidimonas muriae]|uniref:Uncharacterized protein n=1 Tax=Iodidimonas muriae TaxID=261467 RepID=A0ABQ2LEG4_9PROT|nr:hypothetical protein JCM17843_14640 [Kordiimonadales bacterium JCM 17843]GGO12812.1 hypothetical protein GCM10007972_18240 [Iodidimonas muriae]
MDVGAVAPLFDVHRAIIERQGCDLTKFRSAEIVQVFTAAQLGFLRRKAVAVDRGLRRAAGITDIGQA